MLVWLSLVVEVEVVEVVAIVAVVVVTSNQ